MSRPAYSLLLTGVPHCLGTFVQHFRDAIGIALDRPLFFGQVSSELRGVFGDEHQSYIVDVCEKLRDGWAALHRLGVQSVLWERAQQVDQDGVVSVPGVQQGTE
jgi:hypothetical protein